MAKSFGEYLDLVPAYRDRTTLELSAERDWRIYVDPFNLTPVLQEPLRRNPSAPKLMVYGGWGLGKTHTLYHTARQLLPDLGLQLTPVMCVLGNLPKNASFLNVYRNIMARMESFIQQDLRSETPWHRPDTLPTSVNKVIENYKLECRSPAMGNNAPLLWAWLCGNGPSQASSIKLGEGNRLQDFADPDILVRILGAFSTYARQPSVRGKGYMLFIDESAALTSSYLSTQATLSELSWNHINEGFRSLVDRDNNEIGAMFGLFSWAGRRFTLRPDVSRRLQDCTIALPYLDSVETVLRFVNLFNRQMARRDWFTPDGLSWVAQTALEMSARPETPGQLTPEDLIKFLQQIAGLAVGLSLTLPLDVAALSPLRGPRGSA